MADEPLKMRASVVDNATANLRKIRNALLDVSRKENLSGLTQGLKNVRTESGALGREVRTVALPALSAFGLGVSGFTASIVGVATHMRSFSRQMADLRAQSRDLGLTTQQIEAFGQAAAKVSLAPDEAISGLNTFKRNAEDFQLRLGELRGELRKFGAGDVVNAISAAKNPTDQLRIAFERMEEIQKQSPASAKRYAEAMFGSARFARLSWGEFQQALREVKPLSEEQQQQADELNRSWIRLERSATELGRTVSFSMLPGFRDLNKELEAINPNDVETIGRAMGGVLAAGAREAAKFVKELSEALKAWNAIVRAYEKDGLSGAAKEIGRQNGPIFTPDANTYGNMKEMGKVPLSGAIAEQQRRAEEARRRIGSMDTALGRLPADSGARTRLEEARQKEIEALQKMEENIRNLNKELEDANGALRQGRHGWGGGAFVPTAYNPGGGGPAGGPARAAGRGWGGGGYKALPDFDGEKPAPDTPAGGSGGGRGSPRPAGGGSPAASGVGGSPLLDAIARAEGTSGKKQSREYNTTLGFGAYGTPDKPLTEMTLAEAHAFGTKMRRNPRNPYNSSALGRYQIVGTTMKESAKRLGLDWNTTKFNEATQDEMAREIARREGLRAWEGFKAHPRELARAREAMQAGHGRLGGLPIDQANNPSLKAEGTVKVDVHAPQGTRVSAESEGIFQNTELRRHRQMEPATLGPMDVQ